MVQTFDKWFVNNMPSEFGFHQIVFLSFYCHEKDLNLYFLQQLVRRSVIEPLCFHLTCKEDDC